VKKQATGNREQGTGTSDSDGNSAVEPGIVSIDQVAAEVKPKAKPRAKKDAEAAETEPVKAKLAKKAAKKLKPAETESAEVQVAAEPPVTEAAPAKPKKPTPKKAAIKKDKGRDLVVDEPGAKEVAEVLSHTIEDKESDSNTDTADAVEAKGPEPKRERLQKILAKAGISSRRKAEELILGGRVQINGKVVMELGTKADPSRDHVRVDGKLLQGPERIRYFVLNKPKGFVTTVSDPEGRPTVMQFFATEHERLYPVGRLDYLSEGLLLVTNDGELANKLTKAASGVEKTYLVKVAGQPTEDMLDALREGVVIERGRPGTGSGRVRTAPAKIRQVRQGDNPWYEVIIIEGRNRELRKMFEEIGHHVEKIRRVGYGPLVLDLEPGKLRELDAEEVHSLRQAAEGKLKTRRRRGPAPAQLPTVAGKTVRYKKADGKPGFERPSPRPSGPFVRKEFKPAEKRTVRPEFQQESKGDFNPSFRPEFKKEFKPEFKQARKPEFKPTGRPESRGGPGPGARTGPSGGPSFKTGFKAGGRPAFGGKPRTNRISEPPVTDYILPPRKAGPPEPELDDRGPRPKSDFNPDYKPGFRTGAKPAFRSDKPGSKPAFRADGPPKRFGSSGPDTHPGSRGPARGDAKPFRSAPPRRDFVRPASASDDSDLAPAKTPGFRIEPVEDRPRDERPRSGGRTGGFDRAGGGKPFRPAPGRPVSGDRPFRPRTDRPSTGGKPFRPRTDGPPSEGRSYRPAPGPDRDSDRGSDRAGSAAKPFRPRTDRPGTGRASGPPSSGRPFRPSARPDSRSSSERPPRFTPRTDGPPAHRTKSFGASEDRPREFRPRTERTGDGPPKKFAGTRPSQPAGSGKGKTGPDGAPRIKERWRNSFTGKNKGRPKPRSKKDE
jgi:23S rRNA pseudouridine2605 synthase